MKRISKKEFHYALQNMKHAGLEVEGSGSGVTGCASYRINGEKVAHHQWEYEDYYEIHEDYLKYTEFDIANLNKEYHSIQIKKLELEQRERELEYWFYNKYYHIEEKPKRQYDLVLQIKYKEEVYFVKKIGFTGGFVDIERLGQEYTVSLLEFDKLFKEWHNIKIIEWD